MKRRHFLGGCACCGLFAMAGMAHADNWIVPPRLSKPEIGTDEGGLWAFLDREETKLKRSAFLVRDKALNEYVNTIVSRLAGEHYADIRVYIVRSPYFNASMAPNGMMQIWTGLLLRMSNEAQLAAVLGHEIGHYISRHSLDRLRDAKSRTAFGQFLGIAFGLVGAFAQLALLAGMFSFSREQESEADRIGLQLLAQAGYDPAEAAKVWAQLLEELKAEKDWSGDPGERSVLFASHPPAAERQLALTTSAAEIKSTRTETGNHAYRAAIAPHRWGLLEDELRRRKFGESMALLQRMLNERKDDVDIRYFLAEVFRMRGADGDLPLALENLQQVVTLPAAPAETHRAMGMVYQQMGDPLSASNAFQRYVAAKPDAADVEMIRSYIKGGV